MPSCTGADFEVIDQYLSLRDQYSSSEDDSYSRVSDPELPRFPAPFLEGPEYDSSSSSLNSYTGMEEGTELPNFLLWGYERATPVSLPSLPRGPQTATNFVASMAVAGCTVFEASSTSPGAVGYPEDPARSPVLYDMDCEKHTCFYEGDGYNGSVKPDIKVERLEDLYGVGGGMELPAANLGDSCVFREDKEDLTNRMIESLHADILRNCKELNISPDPVRWKAADTLKWISYELKKDQGQTGALAHVDPDVLHVFHMPGEVLCRMSADNFQCFSPSLGAFLHQRLEIWRMAIDIAGELQTIDWHPSASQHPHPHHHHHPISNSHNNYHPHGGPLASEYGAGAPHMPPSISPAPSTDSTCSVLSQSSSSSSSMGGKRGAPHPHPSTGFNQSHERLDDKVFAAAASRCKTPPPVVSHPPPAHVPTPHRGPRPGKQTIHLWQFLRELLDNAESYRDCIKWTDRARGIFKIEDSSKVARLWGRRKNRPAMNYDKLSRSVRQYYKKGIIKKTEHSKRLVYQFCQPYL